MSIFQLTPPQRAEMVPLLHASTAGTGRCIPWVAVKTAVARDGGGFIVAIASANELRACAFFARERPCAFGAWRQLQAPGARWRRNINEDIRHASMTRPRRA
jgi:hypothetical protein